MQTKDAKQGYPIYVLDKKQVTVSTGKITDITQPHYDTRIGNGGKMVVDIEVEIGDGKKSFVLESISEVGYVGDYVVTVNRESVVREIEAIKNQSEDVLKTVEIHRAAVEKCKQLLEEYSPIYRERNETNDRLNAVEEKVDKLADAITAFLDKHVSE